MTGLTTMAVPRGLGLVAALAVSGTALYLVYEYKKKAFVNIRKGKGSLRLEYHVHSNGAQEQKQQRKDFASPGEAGTGAGHDSREGEQVGIVEIHCHHIPCLQRAARRPPGTEQRQPSEVLPEVNGLLSSSGSGQTEESLKERLVKCDEDAALVKALHDTLASYTVGDQQQQAEEELGEKPSKNSQGSAGLKGQTTVSDSLESAKSNRAESLSVSSVCEPLPVNGARDTSVVLPSCSSELQLTAESSFPSTASVSTTVSSSSSKSFAIVGCFVSSGSGKTGVKQKKEVRFSPSVAEPSSNNQDYRKRCKAQIAQKAAHNVRQRTRTESSPVGSRAVATERHRMYSQVARYTIPYSVHRSELRYGGRSY